MSSKGLSCVLKSIKYVLPIREVKVVHVEETNRTGQDKILCIVANKH